MICMVKGNLFACFEVGEILKPTAVVRIIVWPQLFTNSVLEVALGKAPNGGSEVTYETMLREYG